MNNKQIKFNVVDVLLIFVTLLVLTILTVFFFKDGTDYNFSPEKNIYLEVRVEKISTRYRDKIKTGDTIFDTETGKKSGTVSDVNYTASYDNVYNNDTGMFEKVYYQDLTDVEIVIQIAVKESDLTKFKVGKEFHLNVPGFAFSGVLKDVSDFPPNVYNSNNADDESLDFIIHESDGIISTEGI